MEIIREIFREITRQVVAVALAIAIETVKGIVIVDNSSQSSQHENQSYTGAHLVAVLCPGTGSDLMLEGVREGLQGVC